MIGLARLITDHVTFAYLTDVYVLPAHQGTGLGRWLLSCVSEHVATAFPALRGFLLLTRGEQAVRFYRETLGMLPQDEGRLNGLVVMHRDGAGAVTADPVETKTAAVTDVGPPGLSEAVAESEAAG